jgi:hypothetical protein
VCPVGHTAPPDVCALCVCVCKYVYKGWRVGLWPVCFVVTCAGVAAPSGRMAPAKEELDAFDTWLGAEFEGSRGNTIALLEPVKDALAKAFKAEAIDFDDDVPEDGTPLSTAEITEVVSFFVSAFDDYATDGVPKATCKFKLKAWFQARFGEASDDALFNLSKEGNKMVISSDAAGALKADLAEQGMASPFELFALELAVFLGRPVGESEVAGGTYRAPPSTRWRGRSPRAKAAQRRRSTPCWRLPKGLGTQWRSSSGCWVWFAFSTTRGRRSTRRSPRSS